MAGVSANIKDKGGNKIVIVELDSAFALPGTITPGTNSIDLGHLAESNMPTNPKEKEFESEDGVVRAREQSRVIKTEATMMERHKQLVDFIAYTVSGKTYLQYRYAGIVNGKYQEYFAIVQPKDQINIQTPGAAKSNKYEAVHIAPDSAVTFSSENLTAIESALGITIRASGPFTIPEDREFILLETPVT